MISDDITQMVINLVRIAEANGQEPNYSQIQGRIFKKYSEEYPTKMLKRLYNQEKDNPKFRPREIPKPYIETDI